MSMASRILRSALVCSLLWLAMTPEATAQNRQPGTKIQGERARSGAPPLVISDEDLDMGDVPPRSQRKKTVRLRNVGEETIAVVKTSGDCSCTALITDGVVEIKPGGDALLDIMVDTRDMGVLTKKIRVHCDGFDRPFEATVRTNVTEIVEVNRGGLKGLLQPTGVLSLDAIDGRPFLVTSVQGSKPQYVDFDPLADEPRSSYQIIYNLKKDAAGRLPGVVIVETDHPDAPMVAIRYISSGQAPENAPSSRWRSDYDFEVIHRMQPGETVELVVRLGKAGRAVLEEELKVASDNPMLTAEVAALDTSDPKWMAATVRVTASAEAEGFQAASLDFTLGADRSTIVQLFVRVLPR